MIMENSFEFAAPGVWASLARLRIALTVTAHHKQDRAQADGGSLGVLGCSQRSTMTGPAPAMLPGPLPGGARTGLAARQRGL